MSAPGPVPDPRVEILDADAADFSVAVRAEAAGSGTAYEVEVAYRGDEPTDAAVRLVVELAAPDASVLIPGAFYGENRPAANDRVFPRFELGATSPEQHAAMVSDEWHVRADRAATCAVFCWAGPGLPGAALVTDETGELGEQAIGFAVRDGRASLAVTAPAREYPVSYYGDAAPRPAEVRLHRFAPGETVRIRVRVVPLTSDRHDYDRVLRELHAASRERYPQNPWTDAAEAAEIAAEGLVRWHYDPDPGVLLETIGFDREVSGRDGKSVDRQAMHVGWVSGIPWATALLRHGIRTGDERATDAARRVIDFCTAELSPSGTFWGTWYRGRGWSQSWTRIPNGLHARTLGEATDFLLRAIALDDRPRWREAARSNLDAIVGRQRADGALGLIHDATTGEVLSWEGTAALAWVPALVAARDWDERYLPAAERAGAYYADAVHAEYLHGAPEDVDLAPTSEDGYVAVMAYAALYRVTREERWLDLARRAAEWTFTFRYSYDVAFDPLTPLGVYGFRTRGADQASSSNQHVHAYGLICTDELIELSEWTGDDWYRIRAEEAFACFRQLLPRRDGELGAYRGMITERYYQTECFQPKGMILTLSHAWSAGVLLHAAEDMMDGDAGVGEAAAR
ncbi:hypothetical protein H4J02_01305 [Protaetiibacter sp. SSC-01]|uniref:hypothetical protein n=1 Tax=Protaetiibacter sp. SSC-01 TaxID=2759943 RepID=UPI0016573188|nr:hypothetical protein [Protaetiibacter sp. SSC-01]QNO37713.1 hypothetical protein H4J02_01305 [Protaetiibacter sp. SSC-01]